MPEITTFFYLVENNFSHLSICLAEGLHELGIPVYSNINYWQNSLKPDDYLFKYDLSINHQDCSIVFLDTNWYWNYPFPADLFVSSRKYLTVYLEDMDGLRWSLFPNGLKDFDLVLKTHCDNQTIYPANFRPWVFGLSKRILQATQSSLAIGERQQKILANFRTDQQHLLIRNRLFPTNEGTVFVKEGEIRAEYPIRPKMKELFLPLIAKVFNIDKSFDSFEDSEITESYDKLQFKQTGCRHHPQYYERLKNSQASASFGGWLINNYLESGKKIGRWWDSWRLWESWAAGCLNFHVDFHKYGIVLPVMPNNWEHYIGIDVDNIENDVDRLLSEPDLINRIAESGNKWAVKNYSPLPTSIRLLNLLGFSVVELLWLNNLRKINLIVMPDWSQPEEIIFTELTEVIKRIASHPNQNNITLLIDNSNITRQEADLMLSGILMNLMMEEEIDVTETLEILLIGELSDIQWQVLIQKLTARIILESENKEKIAKIQANGIPPIQISDILSYSLNS